MLTAVLLLLLSPIAYFRPRLGAATRGRSAEENPRGPTNQHLLTVRLGDLRPTRVTLLARERHFALQVRLDTKAVTHGEKIRKRACDFLRLRLCAAATGPTSISFLARPASLRVLSKTTGLGLERLALCCEEARSWRCTTAGQG